MKILINIITNTQIAEIKETFPNFTGIFTFNGEQFIPGEWKHVPDDFVVEGTGSQFIKNARWIIRMLVRRHLREQNLHQFAQGIIDAANLYGWDASTKVIPQAVIDLAPEEEIAE